MRFSLLLALAVLLLPLPAGAQRAMCVTPQSRCPGGGQPQGSPCQCPASPRVWGTIVLGGSEQGWFDQQPGRSSRPRLHNDDLDDGDDVLAGPRHHHRPRPDDGGDE